MYAYIYIYILNINTHLIDRRMMTRFLFTYVLMIIGLGTHHVIYRQLEGGDLSDDVIVSFHLVHALSQVLGHTHTHTRTRTHIHTLI